MIGYALRHNRLWSPIAVADIHLPSNSERYQWVGLAWNYLKPDSKVLREELGKDMNAAN